MADVWVRARARAKSGFYRAGFFWPEATIYRRVDEAVAVRLVNERMLDAEIAADSDVPVGWNGDGTFAPANGAHVPPPALRIEPAAITRMGDSPVLEDEPKVEKVLGSATNTAPAPRRKR